MNSFLPNRALADLDALPPGVIGEIIDGVLYQRNRPNSAHLHAVFQIGADLALPFTRSTGGGPGGWWIVAEPALAFPPHTLQVIPDLAGWRRERVKIAAVDPPAEVPDWICEVLSPTTRRHDYMVKVPFYARIGVAFLWLVDVDERRVYPHRLKNGTWEDLEDCGFSSTGDALVPPFDAVPLNVAGWFLPSEGQP